MRLGKLEVKSVSDGLFRLDGGAMFGIVPQPLWSKQTSPDSQNRILLGLNMLLIDICPSLNRIIYANSPLSNTTHLSPCLPFAPSPCPLQPNKLGNYRYSEMHSCFPQFAFRNSKCSPWPPSLPCFPTPSLRFSPSPCLPLSNGCACRGQTE